MSQEKKINDAISRWFDETRKRLDALPNRQSEIEGFCLGILHTVVIYLNASRVLQENGFNFPAMALIRITSDVVSKFLWCLQSVSDSEIENRIQRWEKKTFAEQKRLLNNLKDVVLPTEPLEKVISDLDKKADNHLKEMPNTRKLFQDIKNLFSLDIYALAYLQFNSAVHIDTDLVNKVLMSPLRRNGCDKDILLHEKDVDSLRIVRLSFFYMTLIVIYKYYSWDSGSLTNEYNRILGFRDKLRTKN